MRPCQEKFNDSAYIFQPLNSPKCFSFSQAAEHHSRVVVYSYACVQSPCTFHQNRTKRSEREPCICSPWKHIPAIFRESVVLFNTEAQNKHSLKVPEVEKM